MQLERKNIQVVSLVVDFIFERLVHFCNRLLFLRSARKDTVRAKGSKRTKAKNRKQMAIIITTQVSKVKQQQERKRKQKGIKVEKYIENTP